MSPVPDFHLPGFWTLAIPCWQLPSDPPEETGCGGPYRLPNPMYWSVGSVLLGASGIFQPLALLELAVGYAESVCAMSPRSDGNSARDRKSIAGGRRDGCRVSRPSNRAAAPTANPGSSNVAGGAAIGWHWGGPRRATRPDGSPNDRAERILS